MIYRLSLWFIAILIFSFGMAFVIAGALNNWHPDISSLLVGTFLATTGALIYVHKLRSPPPRDPKSAGDAAP